VPGVPFVRKSKILFHVLLDHFLWPANWFIITAATSIIPFVNPEFSRTALGYSLPIIARVILTSTLVALMVMVVIDYRNRPKY